MQEITINLTPQEVNIVLTSLSKLPYESVFTLIPKIREQAQKQISEIKE
jgi:hypothetical protein